MGGRCSRSNHKRWYCKHKRYVAVCGLAKVGKSALIDCLTRYHKSKVSTQFGLAQVVDQEVRVTLVELEYDDNCKFHWSHQFIGVQGVIYVIDALEDLQPALDLLDWVSQKLSPVPILIVLNKCDLIQPEQAQFLLEQLPIASNLKSVETSCLSSAEGLKGFSWLVSRMAPIS